LGLNLINFDDMAQSNQNSALEALEQMCERLNEVVQTAPLEQAQLQLDTQKLQAERNVKWLDEALGLLNSLSTADNQQQLSQSLKNAEIFVSKSTNDDYDKSVNSDHLSKNN
jgi:hypothetical protein